MNQNVRIKSNSDIIRWAGRKGQIIAIGKEGSKKEYIVQFKKPSEWSHFRRNEFRFFKKENVK